MLEHEGPEAKMAVWAHDLHLMGASDSTLPLGAHLRRLYGDAFYMFRLSFNQGEFRSHLYPFGGPIGDLQTHRIGPASRESLDASLARTGLPLFALDLRGAPTDGPVATYLETPVGMREIGAASPLVTTTSTN
ncbi:erythromycin esterase family protein [Archangium minus]